MNTAPVLHGFDPPVPAKAPVIVVSLSGGKDSTACMLLARETGADVRYVFADTGHEHELTYEYVNDYLPSALGVEITTVKAEFSRQIAGKRVYVAEHWARKGVPQSAIDNALSVLAPTGVPFLDLCLWKGRFPSCMAQFCTQELKRYPLDAFMLDLLGAGHPVESWRGIRRDESQNRRNAKARERAAEGWEVVHPILDWTADQVVTFVIAADLKLNPLYSLGMGRVGCLPCINCGKDELAEIGKRFPDHVARVREWERLVGLAAKRGASSFFTDGLLSPEETTSEILARLNIDARIQWAMTTRGGKQFSLMKAQEPETCSSVYGLCE